MRSLTRFVFLVLAVAIVLPNVADAWPKHNKRPDYRYKVPNLKYHKPKIKGHSAHHVKQHHR